MREQARLISEAADYMGELLALVDLLSGAGPEDPLTPRDRAMLARACIMKADLEAEAFRLMKSK